MDTLSTTRDLERAGFERVKAEAIAAAIWRSHERAATKADLEPLMTKADLAEFERRMASKTDLAALERRMASKADLAALEERMASKADLAELERRMASKADLAALEKRMASKAELAALETHLTNRLYGVGIAVAGVVVAGVKLL